LLINRVVIIVVNQVIAANDRFYSGVVIGVGGAAAAAGSAGFAFRLVDGDSVG
jgi:hypothetical protein